MAAERTAETVGATPLAAAAAAAAAAPAADVSRGSGRTAHRDQRVARASVEARAVARAVIALRAARAVEVGTGRLPPRRAEKGAVIGSTARTGDARVLRISRRSRS